MQRTELERHLLTEVDRLHAEVERLIEVVEFVAGYDPQFPFPASLAISKARAALTTDGKKEIE